MIGGYGFRPIRYYDDCGFFPLVFKFSFLTSLLQIVQFARWVVGGSGYVRY